MTQSQVPLPMRRPPNSLPPCHRCPKVPERVQKDKSIARKWEHAADLAGDVEAVYEHYVRCKTVGRFAEPFEPVDELVAECAYLIASAEQRAENRRRDFAEDRLMLLMQRIDRRSRG